MNHDKDQSFVAFFDKQTLFSNLVLAISGQDLPLDQLDHIQREDFHPMNNQHHRQFDKYFPRIGHYFKAGNSEIRRLNREQLYVRNNSYSERIFGTENLHIYVRYIQLRDILHE